jgi:hypothetical protein
MSDEVIKRALEGAGEAVRQAIIKPPCCMEGTGCELPPCHCASVAAAAAIAAFLEALPPLTALPGPDGSLVGIKTVRLRALATAVRRASGDGA